MVEVEQQKGEWRIHVDNTKIDNRETSMAQTYKNEMEHETSLPYEHQWGKEANIKLLTASPVKVK